MIIEESFSVAAPRDQVAAFLLDVERVSSCVPGVGDVRAVGDDEYEATLRVHLGPIRAQFAGSVRVDGTDAPESLSAVAQGRDGATGSLAQVEFAAVLAEMPDGTTTVASTADVTIRGRLGQFGTGVVTSTAKSLVREFAVCAGQAVEAPPPGSEAAAPTSPEAPSMGRVLRRGMGLYLAGIVTRVGEILRRLLGRRRSRRGERR